MGAVESRNMRETKALMVVRLESELSENKYLVMRKITISNGKLEI